MKDELQISEVSELLSYFFRDVLEYSTERTAIQRTACLVKENICKTTAIIDTIPEALSYWVGSTNAERTNVYDEDLDRLNIHDDFVAGYSDNKSLNLNGAIFSKLTQ